MWRIDTSGATPNRPTPGPENPEGWFLNGTVADEDWFNGVQGELHSILAKYGVTPDKTNVAQIAGLMAFNMVHGGTTLAQGTSGSFTFPPGVLFYHLRGWSAGGGGGGAANGQCAAGGGEGGRYFEGIFPVNGPLVYAIAGQAMGGTPGNPGAPGGQTGIGSCNAPGGAPGQGAAANSISAGGASTNPPTGQNIYGAIGGQGTAGATQGGLYFGGFGGAGPFSSLTAATLSAGTGNFGGLASGGAGGNSGGGGGYGGGGLGILDW